MNDYKTKTKDGSVLFVARSGAIRSFFLDRKQKLNYTVNEICRRHKSHFTTIDPARDGHNWYAYCGNNPVIFSDPTGLTITCSEEDSAIVIMELEKITDDVLGYEDGRIIIIKRYETDKKVGQTLVDCLISSPDTVNINLGYKDDVKTKVTNITTGFSEYNIEGKPLQIYFDPNKVETAIVGTLENNSEEDIPSHIVLGHELVHAYRAMYGLRISDINKTAEIAYDTSKLQSEEEIQTVGINYTNKYNNTSHNRPSYKNSITENGLRIENKLPERIMYE